MPTRFIATGALTCSQGSPGRRREDRAAAKGQHPRGRQQPLRRRLFQHPEGRLAVLGEDLGDRLAGLGLDHRVDVGECGREPFRKQRSDSRLSRARSADDDHVAHVGG
jgi:hypothetical protein